MFGIASTPPPGCAAAREADDSLACSRSRAAIERISYNMTPPPRPMTIEVYVFALPLFGTVDVALGQELAVELIRRGGTCC